MDPTQTTSTTDPSAPVGRSGATSGSDQTSWSTSVGPGLDAEANQTISDINSALTKADYATAQQKADGAVSTAQDGFTAAMNALPQSQADADKMDATTLANLQKNVQTARDRLATAEDASARVYEQIAHDSANQAAKEPDPARQKLWQEQSQLADAHAQEVRANIDAIKARTQDDIQKAQAAVTNANARAQQVQNLIPTEEQKNVAAANLYDTRSAQLPALTSSQIQANTARANYYGTQAARNANYDQYLQARTQQVGAQTGETNARTDVLNTQASINDFKLQSVLPAQLDNLVATGQLTAARAAYWKTVPDLKWATLANTEHFDDAKIAQIQYNITKQQVLPLADKTEPTLAVFQPGTGQVTGVPNPAYVNQQSQAISDYQQTVQLIQQQIASGSIDPKSADALMSQTYQALQAKIKGTTPADYEKQQQDVALRQQTNALTQQQNAAQTLMSGAQEAAGIGNSFMSGAFQLANNPHFTKAPNLNGFDPYAAGADVVNRGVMGSALSAARSILATVKPIDPKDPLSFQDALGKTAIAHAVNQGAIDPQTAATMLNTAPALGAVLHGAAAAGANNNPQQPPMPAVPAPGQPTGPIIPQGDQSLQVQAQGGGTAPPGSPGQSLLTAANPANNLGSNADYSSLGGSF